MNRSLVNACTRKIQQHAATYPFILALGARIDALCNTVGTWLSNRWVLAVIFDTYGSLGWASVINVVGIDGRWKRIDAEGTSCAFDIGCQGTGADTNGNVEVTALVRKDLFEAIWLLRVNAESAMVPCIATNNLASIAVHTDGVFLGASLIDNFWT
jgi:hypothetical protein